MDVTYKTRYRMNMASIKHQSYHGGYYCQNWSIMIDKMQKISSYVSGHGLRVYEIEQYNEQCKDWFIVGNCSENIEYIAHQVEKHNQEIAFTREWVSQCIPF
jgi:hypothetical protein